MPNNIEIVAKYSEDRDLRDIREASRSLLLSLVFSVFFLLLFTWISSAVFADKLERFDIGVRMRVHDFFSPDVTKFMLLTTSLGSISFLTMLFIIIVGIWLALGMKRPAVWLMIAVGGSIILDTSLKLAFHRARPPAFVGVDPRSYSFPSGHALSSFCFYGVLAGLICSRIESRGIRIAIWTAAAALIFAIGLSRVYLGVHYPTDVIAGYIAAAAWVSTLLVAVYSHRHIKARAVK